jgi:ribosomal-protein-alanine N-acetyltransferase
MDSEMELKGRVMMELKPNKCTLRAWQPGDEESLVHHANNKKVWINLRDSFPHPYTASDALSWIQKASAETPQRNFAIVVHGKAVGAIGFILKEDVYRRSAEIGFWLGEEFWGQGIVTEALSAVTEYAFANFDFCRLYACVFEWNPASMRVLEKAGYNLEARLKKAVTKEGKTIDEFLYAIVRS